MPVLGKTRGVLLIISGPAGSGKTTLCERLAQVHSPRLSRVVTATTRVPRKEEHDGVDYHFLTLEEFEARVAEGAFCEHAVVHGKRYGVLKSEVLAKLEAGDDLVLSVDVQGADTFCRTTEEDDVFRASLTKLFLMPPNMEVIRRRLEDRGTDDVDEINGRLRAAEEEMSRWREYDYCIISGDREQDFARADAIYKAERMRVTRLAEAG